MGLTAGGVPAGHPLMSQVEFPLRVESGPSPRPWSTARLRR